MKAKAKRPAKRPAVLSRAKLNQAMEQANRDAFLSDCRLYFATPVTEYALHAGRKWRFDFAWPIWKLALEVEGGVWTGGRHTRGKGFLADCEKYNEATIQGWSVLRVTPQQVRNGFALSLIKRWMASDDAVTPLDGNGAMR